MLELSLAAADVETAGFCGAFLMLVADAENTAMPVAIEAAAATAQIEAINLLLVLPALTFSFVFTVLFVFVVFFILIISFFVLDFSGSCSLAVIT